MWDQSWVAKQFLKISVYPPFLLTVSPPIAPVKPCSVSLAASSLPPVYSFSHTLWAGFQSCTQISLSLTIATFQNMWQNSSPAAHSSSSYSTSSPLAACLLLPPLHVPAAGPQLPTSSSISPTTSSTLYLPYFLSYFSISNQKQNSCGISECAWSFAYKGASGLTLFCGNLCMCNTSI